MTCSARRPAGPAGWPRCAGGPPPPAPVHLLVAQQVGGGDRGVRHVAGQPRGVVGLGQPGRQPGDHLGGPHPLGDDVGGQEAGLHEVAQGASEGVLALDDDRRVGDGQAQRAAEQRGDGEPVGQAADHAGRNRRLEVAHPGGVAAHTWMATNTAATATSSPVACRRPRVRRRRRSRSSCARMAQVYPAGPPRYATAPLRPMPRMFPDLQPPYRGGAVVSTDRSAGVTVVGAGVVGLTCALRLAEAGHRRCGWWPASGRAPPPRPWPPRCGSPTGPGPTTGSWRGRPPATGSSRIWRPTVPRRGCGCGRGRAGAGRRPRAVVGRRRARTW